MTEGSSSAFVDNARTIVVSLITSLILIWLGAAQLDRAQKGGRLDDHEKRVLTIELSLPEDAKSRLDMLERRAERIDELEAQATENAGARKICEELRYDFDVLSRRMDEMIAEAGR